MLTNHILSWYNHLLATSLIYFSLNDPIRQITKSIDPISAVDQFSIFTVALAQATQDYYEILGVKKDATKQEIHRAFRQLAKKYHPDKNKEKGAQDEFIKIFKAYETLSDEKKRKEYDNRSSNQNGPFSNGWHANMNDGFDMNDFFKHYEDQLFRHAQHFNEHNHNHNHNHQYHHDHHHGDKFMFHGVNLDDLFHDIDEDEFSKLFDFAGHQQHHYAQHHNHRNYHNYDDGTFGDGASYFGSHFPSQVLDTLHEYQQHQGFHRSDKKSSSYSCQTITKQVNGMVMTQTSCG